MVGVGQASRKMDVFGVMRPITAFKSLFENEVMALLLVVVLVLVLRFFGDFEDEDDDENEEDAVIA
jgi:hypothetical protein